MPDSLTCFVRDSSELFDWFECSCVSSLFPPLLVIWHVDDVVANLGFDCGLDMLVRV